MSSIDNVIQVLQELANWSEGYVAHAPKGMGSGLRAEMYPPLPPRAASEIQTLAEAGLISAKQTKTDLAQAQRWIREYGNKAWFRDHACAQCDPHSEMLKPGFVCAVHKAKAAGGERR